MAIPNFPELEEKILAEWADKEIFKKTLAKDSPRGNFVFFDGPPTANGMPHIGHVETRVFKDLIPRFKTMQGYHVERKAGWDTQGLPVELEVEKELGISGKKDIETYGIAKFNAKAKESVWKYKNLWEQMTNRVGFWLDQDHPYITYTPDYIETLWWIFKQTWDQGLLVQDYKVVPYCPRCGTALSSHEVAQGYESVTEPSVYIKFELVDEPGTFVLAWTTTPWTLPGNVALAINPKFKYTKVTFESGESYILEDSRVPSVIGPMMPPGKNVTNSIEPINPSTIITRGVDILGKKYKPLFDFLDFRTIHPADAGASLKPAPTTVGGATYTIVPADFVTTEDGTGVVHTAVMYGEEDFQLGKKVGLPTVHTVDEQGKFNELVKPWVGWEVKDAEGKTQATIIDWLKEHKKLYKVEDYTHDYPFCWRCKNPLLYYAKTSWFIQMSKLRAELIKNNETINWYPAHIKEGRFGEWLREVKDWAISRERYWGTPIPIWTCDECKYQECLGSYQELTTRMASRNRYIFVRHGHSKNNEMGIINSRLETSHKYPLTDGGVEKVKILAQQIAKEKPTAIYSSPYLRTQQTADIIARETNLNTLTDNRLGEVNNGYDEKTHQDYHRYADKINRFLETVAGAETWTDVRTRMFNFMHEIDRQYQGQTIVIVSHADPIMLLEWGISMQTESALVPGQWLDEGESKELKFVAPLYQPDGSFDPHRPFVDEWTYPCPKCTETTPARSATPPKERRGRMSRIPEVADAWFDSGAMPFAQWHYPFENKERIDGGVSYPAEFISEAIDQTRGWFYTLLAISTLLAKAKVIKDPAFKNVVVLGHLNDAQGRKLSKSLKNYGNLDELFAKHGADAIRWFMYTANQPWDPKNFDTKIVDEGVRKTFLILMNVLSFWQMYAGTPSAPSSDGAAPPQRGGATSGKSNNILDRWINSLTDNLVQEVTDKLAKYDVTGAARMIADFITNLSTWYVRRSRDRFKSVNAPEAVATLQGVLLTISKVMAPFTPFLAEHLYQQVGGSLESVHLESWPTVAKIDQRLLDEMSQLRQIVEQGHALRAQAGIKVRQPLGQAVVSQTLRIEFLDILKDEMNVKEISEDKELAKLPTEYLRTVDNPIIALDATVTDELKEEGMLRDLVRAVNALRKTSKLVPSDQIIFHVEPNTMAAKLVEHYGAQFLADIRAKAATPSMEGVTEIAELVLDGKTEKIGLTRV